MKPSGDVAWRGVAWRGDGRIDGKHSDTDMERRDYEIESCEPIIRRIYSLALQISKFFFCYAYDWVYHGTITHDTIAIGNVSYGFNFEHMHNDSAPCVSNTRAKVHVLAHAMNITFSIHTL